MIRSPLRIVGGKYFLSKKLLELIPPHEIYVEPFCGAAHLFFRKPKSKKEVLNDKDELIINFFKVLQDPVKAEELARRVYFTPHSRKIYYEAYEILETRYHELNDLEKAYYFIITNFQNFSGRWKAGWAFDIKNNRRWPQGWNKLPKRLLSVTDRLKEASLECDDFEKILKRYDTPKTFFYCDPPYLLDSRMDSSQNYRVEFSSVEDHERFLKAVKRLKGKIMITHYPHPLYDKNLKGWYKKDFHVVIFSRGSARIMKNKKMPRRVERVYMNYKPPRKGERFIDLVKQK